MHVILVNFDSFSLYRIQSYHSIKIISPEYKISSEYNINMKIISNICGISFSNLKLVVCKFITKTRALVLPVRQSLCSAVPLYHTFSFLPCRSETQCESLPSLWIPVLRSQKQSREVTVLVSWWFFYECRNYHNWMNNSFMKMVLEKEKYSSIILGNC